MSNPRRITISTRVMVTLECEAQSQDGEVNVTRVLRAHLPTATEVMEALDSDGLLGDLDELYEAAGGAR
jgi:hypothetical protein